MLAKGNQLWLSIIINLVQLWNWKSNFLFFIFFTSLNTRYGVTFYITKITKVDLSDMKNSYNILKLPFKTVKDRKRFSLKFGRNECFNGL